MIETVIGMFLCGLLAIALAFKHYQREAEKINFEYEQMKQRNEEFEKEHCQRMERLKRDFDAHQAKVRKQMNKY